MNLIDILDYKKLKGTPGWTLVITNGIQPDSDVKLMHPAAIIHPDYEEIATVKDLRDLLYSFDDDAEAIIAYWQQMMEDDPPVSSAPTSIESHQEKK